MNKTLYLVRGLPGSGKTTFAKSLTVNCVAADDYPGLYEGEFHPELLGAAHAWCQGEIEDFMAHECESVAVHNTLTTEKEIKPYVALAERYGYRIVSLVVENRHGNKSVHGVPDEALARMRDRFTLSL